MTLKGGNSQACAACKYQRRKCSSECPLAPYFPPDQTKMFQNAHKLFGVRNIVKILENLDPTQKQEAMRSINYQAYIRDRYPVHGCLGVITQLQFQIRQAEEELHAIYVQLEMYKQHPHQHQNQIASLADDVASQLVLGMAPPTNNQFNLFGHVNVVASNITNASWLDSKDCVWSNSTNNTDSVHSQTIPIQQVTQCYDEIYPFFDNIDDRQSYIDSKEGFESSLEESLEHVAENELKSAAACFSLTSVNS